MRIGSAMIDPTVIRGSSDAYGSWKTIWILPRIARSARRFCSNTSTPSRRTDPDVGSTSRSTRRPVVVLPQPDSPTMPSVSPFATLKLTPETAFTVAVDRRRNTAADRELLHEVGDLEDRLPGAARLLDRGHACTSRSSSVVAK